MDNYISNFFLGYYSVKQLCDEAKKRGITGDELIEKMSSWRILNESEHASDLVALQKEAEAAIRAMMGDRK